MVTQLILNIHILKFLSDKYGYNKISSGSIGFEIDVKYANTQTKPYNTGVCIAVNINASKVHT